MYKFNIKNLHLHDNDLDNIHVQVHTSSYNLFMQYIYINQLTISSVKYTYKSGVSYIKDQNVE